MDYENEIIRKLKDFANYNMDHIVDVIKININNTYTRNLLSAREYVERHINILGADVLEYMLEVLKDLATSYSSDILANSSEQDIDDAMSIATYKSHTMDDTELAYWILYAQCYNDHIISRIINDRYIINELVSIVQEILDATVRERDY